MAVDATGTASTKFSIPKYNTGGDAPSGKGLNNIIDSLDTILSNLGIAGLVANDVPVYDSVAGKWKKATGTPSATTFLRGDGSWQSVATTRNYTEVTKTVAQSIANATFTAVTFNSETFDDSNLHDNVTNNTRFTIPAAGLWLFGAWVEWAANGSGGRQAGITLNSGTSLVAIDVPAGGQAFSANGGPLVVPHVCAVNDFVELFVYQSSGGALNVNPTTTKFWATRLA